MTHKIITSPNIISMVRMLLVPTFVILYFVDFSYHAVYALAVLVLSGVSDVVDGMIARKFSMISDVGKLLDPLADKLTQVAVVICLASTNRQILPLVVIVFVKELIMILGALCLFAQGRKPSEAKWWGKLTTVVLYAVLCAFLIAECLENPIHGTAAAILVMAAGFCLVFSLLSYYTVFKAIIKGLYNPDRDDRHNLDDPVFDHKEKK